MSLTLLDIAEAFSQHRFAEAEPYIAEDVEWALVEGKSGVIAACEANASELLGLSTEFTRFETVVGETSVAIESVAEYVDAAGDKSVVASCDFYYFVDGRLTSICSHTSEL